MVGNAPCDEPKINDFNKIIIGTLTVGSLHDVRRFERSKNLTVVTRGQKNKLIKSNISVFGKSEERYISKRRTDSYI